jgi:hypothetical protein
MIIADLYGPETDQWTGKKITLYATNVKAFGKKEDAIRIRTAIPSGNTPAAHVEEHSSLDDDENVTDYGDELFDTNEVPA